MEQGYSVYAHSAGAYTATLPVMAPPSPAWANFYPHDGMHARKQPLLLCVLCGNTVPTLVLVIFTVVLSLLIGSGPAHFYPQRCCPVLRRCSAEIRTWDRPCSRQACALTTYLRLNIASYCFLFCFFNYLLVFSLDSFASTRIPKTTNPSSTLVTDPCSLYTDSGPAFPKKFSIRIRARIPATERLSLQKHVKLSPKLTISCAFYEEKLRTCGKKKVLEIYLFDLFFKKSEVLSLQ
jgi:hypothetical protein